jgi:phosphoesterase RecJ-like protein
VDPGFSAMGEIVYQLLKLMEVTVSKSIAACLYTSIITDTGSFRYSSTSKVTHAIAGELISTGIDFSRIHRKVYDDKPISLVKFTGRAIEKMEMVNEKISVIKLIDKDFLDFGLDPTINTSDIIALSLEVNTAEVAVLFKEAGDLVKVSLRSKSDIDVRKVAEKFGGGGHTKASGLTINNASLDEAVELVLKEIEKELI